jgi:hypothetical protein
MPGLTMLKTCILGGLIATAAGAMAAESDNPLAQERWKTRPLIVIATSAGDPVFKQLTSSLEEPRNREAFIERDMVLYTVIGDRGQRNGVPLSQDQTQALISALDERPEGEATVILVGKDGGKKIVQQGQIDPAAIFATIDKMPMRQR